MAGHRLVGIFKVPPRDACILQGLHPKGCVRSCWPQPSLGCKGRKEEVIRRFYFCDLYPCFPGCVLSPLSLQHYMLYG